METTPSLQERLNNGFLLMLFTVLATWQLGLYPAGMHEDDAFFYFQIARNLIETGQSTFDGIGITNGYHLLWMWILSRVGMVFAQAMPIDLSLIAVSILPLAVFAWLCRPLVYLQILVACFFVGLGMEGVFAALLFLLLAWALQERRYGLAMVFTIGVVLSRVDFVLCLVLLLIWAMATDRRLVMPLLLGTVFGVLLNFGGNYLITGEIFSISSLQKSGIGRSIASPEMVVYNFTSTGNQTRICMWFAAMAVLLLARRKLGTDQDRLLYNPIFHLCLIAFIAAHSVTSALRDWYFAAPVLVAIYAAGHAASGLSWRAMPTLVFCILLPAAVAVWQVNRHYEAAIAYRGYIDELTAIDKSPLFVFDGAGYIAWRLHPVAVINGDGLVNSFNYARNARDPDWFMTYLAENGVSRFVTNRALKTCITATICCEDDSLEEVARVDTAHGGLADKTYAFKDGLACSLIPRPVPEGEAEDPPSE